MFGRAALLLVFTIAAAEALAAEVLPPGSVYGTTDGCAAVVSGQYPASDDWVVVTRKYMRQHESVCSFVQALPDRYGSLFVNAICSGEGETWPASFAVTKGEDDGSLRLSDTNNNPWDMNVCEGVDDAAADKLFGE